LATCSTCKQWSEIDGCQEGQMCQAARDQWAALRKAFQKKKEREERLMTIRDAVEKIMNCSESTPQAECEACPIYKQCGPLYAALTEIEKQLES
jgi:hypothetical protein